ncbi:16263_t:CDS:1 [Acaulospora morrowiae]|uniref:16263_t:CDS:1 n=1 Tax=Acaulospora morrowiae TaxID=94023 RepID=A0A9N9E9X2_9GLOM|nr:16263_t:CDS:1 [Acaulospora morrowiae]
MNMNNNYIDLSNCIQQDVPTSQDINTSCCLTPRKISNIEDWILKVSTECNNEMFMPSHSRKEENDIRLLSDSSTKMLTYNKSIKNPVRKKTKLLPKNYKKGVQKDRKFKGTESSVSTVISSGIAHIFTSGISGNNLNLSTSTSTFVQEKNEENRLSNNNGAIPRQISCNSDCSIRHLNSRPNAHQKLSAPHYVQFRSNKQVLYLNSNQSALHYFNSYTFQQYFSSYDSQQNLTQPVLQQFSAQQKFSQKNFDQFTPSEYNPYKAIYYDHIKPPPGAIQTNRVQTYLLPKGINHTIFLGGVVNITPK